MADLLRHHGAGIQTGREKDRERSEEHTSELQSRRDLVCRLLLEPHVHPPDLHSFPTRRSSDLSSAASIADQSITTTHGAITRIRPPEVTRKPHCISTFNP